MIGCIVYIHFRRPSFFQYKKFSFQLYFLFIFISMRCLGSLLFAHNEICVNILDIMMDLDTGLFREWAAELEENPRFRGLDLGGDGIGVFERILGASEGLEVPDFSESVGPIFRLWHEIREKAAGKGLSPKDLALMLYSFKLGLLRYLRGREGGKKFEGVGNLLDLLGLFTFEFYSSETEGVISRRGEQIGFLEGKRSGERFGSLVGTSSAMQGVYEAIGVVLDNDIAVLLEGESGTGKDMVANVIHSNSKRKSGPFITLNCGAIPKELVESELFGHEQGAFTGALVQRTGKFELADGGTLFLDEIGELPMEMQVKLLRVLQDKAFERVGGSEKIEVDVRIVAATNRDLKGMVSDGTFRQDLFYRLHVFPIRIPPLRERVADILPLAQFFLEKYASSFGYEVARLSGEACDFLESQNWEGNVRELENLMQRVAVLAPGQVVGKAVLEFEPGSGTLFLPAMELESDVLGLRDGEILSISEAEKRAIRHALKVTKGNMKKAAEGLGVSRTTLYSKIEKYDD